MIYNAKKFFKLISVFLLVAVVMSCGSDNPNPNPDPNPNPPISSPLIVGALRWDAWHKPVNYEVHGIYGGPVKAMERSLSPNQYQTRAPYFSNIIADDQIQIDGYTQEILDQEIEYASTAGLDYWAFLLYAEGNVMSEGLEYYLSSTKKEDVKFCAMAQRQNLINERNRLIQLIKEPSYQMVFDNRPLIYIYGLTVGETNIRPAIDALRKSVKAEGFGDPYIVLMDFSASTAKSMMNQYGGNAISSYAIVGDGGNNSPYYRLTSFALNDWTLRKSQQVDVVPTVTTGWNRSPRIDNPVPWEPWQEPGVNPEKIFGLPTAQELAIHLQDGMNWVESNKAASPAQAVLIYAWNENDEGGWLVPTLTESGGIDNSRLEALKSVLTN